MAEQAQVTFILDKAPDDPNVSTSEFQEKLSKIGTLLRISEISPADIAHLLAKALVLKAQLSKSDKLS